jgi:branched-chain amino acid aminotransferase
MRAIPNPKNKNEILLFRLDNHAKRLSNSAKILGYSLESSFIHEKIIEFIQLNKPQNPIYIRPLVYTSDLDISPRLHNIEHDFLIY